MLMTAAQAAEAAGVPRARIYAWIRTGRLPAVRFGPRSIRIAPADLERARTDPPPRRPPSRPRTKTPRRRTAPKAPRPRPPREDVNAWIDDFYHHYDRIPPRDEIRHAFLELTQFDAEQYLRDARTRLWNRES